ncbi:autotransporter serine protease [Glaciimonas soli]|nr:autotransporter serine protease [Glaciimonas soli]
MQYSVRFSLSAISLAVSTLLTACGGGGGGSTNPNPGSSNTLTTPPSATSTTTSPSPTSQTSAGLLNTNDPANKNAANAAGITGAGVTVGVVDTDFDLSDPQLTGRITKTVYTTFGNTNLNGNGNPHGTEVSEALGGTTAGVAPGVQIDGAAAGGAVGTTAYDGVGMSSQIYQDLYNKGVRIFNQSSASTYSPTSVSSNALTAYASNTANIYRPFVTQGGLFVWAAGNESAAQPDYPAALPALYPELQTGWLAVTAVNAVGGTQGFSSADTTPGVISSYANRCGAAANWCLAAPGDFVSTESGTRVYGTSFATPMVTGTLALIQQVYPWMNADLLRQTVLSTATAMGDPTVYGWGLLNASKAVNGPALFDTRLTLGNSSINVNFDTVSSVFSNNIAGDAGLLKGGTGTLTLSGTNTYTGLNQIAGGTLNITGSITSGVQIDAAGNLAGAGGHIGGSVANNGTLSNTGKGLTIAGNYTASATSVLVNDAISTLTVGGTATLANSQLVVTDLTGYVTSQAKATTVLTAGAGVSGQFNANTTFPSLITGVISYGANAVGLSLVRSSVTAVAAKAFSADATRTNSAANVEQALTVADNMVASGQTGGANAAFLASATALEHSANLETVGVALDSLSGQIYASSQALTFQQSQAVNHDLSNRLAQLGQQNPSLGTGFWASAIGASGKLAETGYATADTSLWGGQFGFDTLLSPRTIVGVALAYSDSKASFDRFGGSSKSQNVGVSLYGRYALAQSNAYVSARVGVATVDSQVNRTAIIGTEIQNLNADHTDSVLSAYAETGYGFKLSGNNGDNSITPFAGLSIDQVRRGGFTETGGSFGLNASAQTYQRTASVLGVRADSSVNWFSGTSKLQAYAAWQHAFTNGNLGFSSTFNGTPGSSFTVQGIGLPQNSGWAGLGISTAINQRWSWYANYDMQFGRGGLTNNVLSAGLRISLD